MTEGSPTFGPSVPLQWLGEQEGRAKGMWSLVSGVLDPGVTPGSVLLNAVMKCSPSRAQCLFPSD